MKKKIKLTEGKLRSIVRNVLNEIGDSEKGQRWLGALHARNTISRGDFRKGSDVYDYAKAQRGFNNDNDEFDDYGEPVDPEMYYAYANGYVDYMNAHPNDLAQRHQENERGLNESYDDIRNSRLEGLESIILYFDDMYKSGRQLSPQQIEQLSDAAETATVFGEYGQYLYDVAQEIIENN